VKVMNRRNNNFEFHGLAAWARRTAAVAGTLGLGLGLALGAFAQSPTGTSPSGTNPMTDPPHVYSWPNFHAGGAPPDFLTPLLPVPGEPNVPYGQLQGTPMGLYTIPGTATAGTFTEPSGTAVTTQIPSRLLGNYLPTAPPVGFAGGIESQGLAYFPNHFRDGGTPQYLQIVGPFGYTYPNPLTGTYPVVKNSPAAVNVIEYPDLAGASYYGVAVDTANVIGDTDGNLNPTDIPSIPDTTKFGPNTNAAVDAEHQIRQVVYFGRTEVVPVIATANGPEAGGVAVPTGIPVGENVQVGAIYAMDGFTGGIIWRYQVPSFRATSQAATANPFTSNTSGTVSPTQAANAPQQFQIGPTVGNVGAVGQTGLTPGTLNITSTNNLGGLPSQNLQYTMYATAGTPYNDGSNSVLYSGVYAIYPPATGGPTPVIASQGYFTVTATFTSATSSTATVTGTFTATTGATTYSPATFTGNLTVNAGVQTLSGTLDQSLTNALSFGTPQVYSSPVVTRCLVTPPAGGTPTLKTVVIVGDNNGFLYCLDAVGNGDGSSNSNIYPANQLPTVTQTGIAYDAATSTAEGLPLDPSGNPAHVGTTFPYWIYRPDPNSPKYVTGTQVGMVKPASAFDANSDLPIPSSFGTASPNVYVNPSTGTGTVYVGNSNGVLYAFDATGVTSTAATTTTTSPTSDPYNNPLTGLPGVADTTNTPKPLWWFSTGGPGPDANPLSSITSTPAVYLDPANGYDPVVYVGTSSALGDNTGRIYAVDGINGPRGNNGESDPTNTNPMSNTYGAPGSVDYNVNPRPYWAFPDQYGNDYVNKLGANKPAGYESWSTNGDLRPSLGDITGSPVIFNDPHNGGSTRIYFAANAGTEVRTEGTGTTASTSTFPADEDSDFGRVWGINTNGSLSVPTGNSTGNTDTGTQTWVYPNANNPNNSATDGVVEPSQPMGGFLNATPAMGLVEFPDTIYEGTGVAWAHTDEGGARNITFNGSAASEYNQIAMLYVGTYTPNDASFYEIDVDGQNDTERNIYRLVSPNGAGFQSSPALITNSSVDGGNGGAIYISAANTLYQFQATPITNAAAGQAYPFIAANGDAALSGAGPISSPAVAAGPVGTITNATNPPLPLPGNTDDTVRDWVYICDDNLSLCRGFTPNQSSFGNSAGYLPLPPVPSQVASSSVSGQFPLRAYIFDGTGTHLGTSADMNAANTVGGVLPVFDWGQQAYIRIANVAPPAGAIDDDGPESAEFPLIPGTTHHQALVIDPTDTTGDTAYEGGPITFQLEDATTSAIGATLQIPAIAPALTTPTTHVINPSQNGFYIRADHGTFPETTSPGNSVVLLDSNDAVNTTSTTTNTPLPTGFGWVGAYTYNIGFADGTLLANTPGAQRRLINVQQQVTKYTLQGGVFALPPTGTTTSVDTMPTGDFLAPIPNNTTGGYNDTHQPTADGTVGSLGTPIPIDQPTFGILNPLAVRGGGLPIDPSGIATPQPLGGFVGGGNLVDGIGPFRAVNPLLNTQYDLQALANGNLVYTSLAPTSGAGVTAGTTNPTQATATLNAQAASLPQAILNVATSTPQILDGSEGDNSDPNGPTAPAVGDYNGGVGSGLQTPDFGPAMLDIADRSLLSQVDQPLQVSIDPANVQWNDNAMISGTTVTNGLGSGSNATINHLPWEDSPISYNFGTNGSVDYPDIPQQDLINDFSDGSSVSNASLTPTSEPNNVGTPPIGTTDRQVNPESVRVQINVPKFQPANLQLYQVTGALGAQTQQPTSPLVPATNMDLTNTNGPADTYFPMGYVATEKVYASTNGTRNANDPNIAYRNVQVYTGVPVDIKTSITNSTTDVGVEPAGFGTQMTNAVGPFTPYNAYAGFTGHFQPLSITSSSNVNLLDPHLDQKIATVNTAAGQAGQAPGLPLLADASDSSLVSPYSYIPGYDFAAVSDVLTPPNGTTNAYTLNGPNSGTGNPFPGTTIVPQPFLIRSSLDTDIGEVYGRNPELATEDTATDYYPTVTIHKPRVGDGTGSAMTIPDVPHDNTGAYALTSETGQLNVGASGQLVEPNTTTAATTTPYVGIAIPFGTPVGVYAQNLRLFEGYDTNYNPFIGPTYDGNTGGRGTFNPDTLVNTYAPYGLGTFLLNYSNGIAHSVQPYSDPATQLRVTVGENRLTDGFTAGALPMIDLGPSNTTTNSMNFAPFALQQPYPGELGLYWSSSRDYVAGNSNTHYQLNAAKLNVQTSNGLPTYYAADAQQWWESLENSATFSLNNQPNGNNIAFSVAQTQAPFNSPGTGYGLSDSASELYGFGTTVAANGPLSTTTLYYVPMSLITTVAGTGEPPQPIGPANFITSSPQPKSDQHGLNFSGVSFADPNGGANIDNNLWSFWTEGTRGRTGLYYSSTTAQGATVGSFTAPTALPVPAGLVAVNDPNPVLTNAPDLANTTGAPVPAIEVTYSGTGANGTPDLYLSRYRPYRTAGTPSAVQLGLMPFPALQEQLLPDTANINTNSWWQARDVGWVRNENLQFSINVSVPSSKTGPTPYQTYTVILAVNPLTATNPTYTTYTGHFGMYNGSYDPTQSGSIATNGTPFTGGVAYDSASGILVLTNVTLPRANGTGVSTATGQTVYVDVTHGRIRFSLSLPYSSPEYDNTNSTYSTILANFSATARRITTSSAADTEPIAFLDEAYQPNSSGVTTDQNVQADRYWFLWRKSGVSGTNPTIWYKTQRLGVTLTSSDDQPPAIDLTTLTVKLPGGAILYTPGGTNNVVDVDTTRGRLYFPITFSSTGGGGTNSTAMEGQTVNITYSVKGSNGDSAPINGSAVVDWLDEPLYNDSTNQSNPGALEAAASDGYQLPMTTTINESGVSAFLDTGAFQNSAQNSPRSIDPGQFNTPSQVVAAVHPHKVWVFWTSNRNGTADIFSEAINPRFSAAGTSGTP
jgi:hypothetical protein